MTETEKREKSAEEKAVLVKEFEIKETLPCFTTPGYIRFIAQADNKLGEVIPVILLKFPPGKTNYSIKQNTLTLKLFNRMISIFPSGKIGVTNTRDKEEAKEILQKIADMINDAYRACLKRGKPSQNEIEAAAKLSWMDVYDCLPKTNCGKCGFQTCSAFAVSLLQGEAKLSSCTPLKNSTYSSHLKRLQQKIGKFMLRALG